MSLLRKIVRTLIKYTNFTYNLTSIKLNKVNVSLESVRAIRGKLLIINYGNLTIGDNVKINSSYRSNPIGGNACTSILVKQNAELIIGNNVGISNSALVCDQKIVIEDFVFIGGDCKIYDTDFHSIYLDDRINLPETNIKSKPVMIKRGAFVGTGVTILKGVTIGEEAIIAAGSVVTKSIPEKEVWGGNPVQFIKRI